MDPKPLNESVQKIVIYIGMIVTNEDDNDNCEDFLGYLETYLSLFYLSLFSKHTAEQRK